MKKIYSYSLENDYLKKEYVMKTDYCFAEDRGSGYRPISLPQKSPFTLSDIPKNRLGIVLDCFYDGYRIILDEPDHEKAKEIFEQMLNKNIRNLMYQVIRYEKMKIAVEEYKEDVQ